MPLPIDFLSLRGKITTAYAILVFATFILGTIAFLDLLFLESRISESSIVTSFKDAVLEMRREEKNLFLYVDPDALSRANVQSKTLLGILGQHAAILGPLIKPLTPEALSLDITRYRDSMQEWASAALPERRQLQEEIGKSGQKITATAESVANKQRQALEEAVKQSRWFFLISLLLIGAAILVVGRRLRRVAVRPLRAMEASMAPIADGRFDHLEPPSREREFITLTDAFNRMLRELEIRRKRMLQSDKLASLGILSAGVAH
ncbi:MAG: HAMP domain-containing protein, partial [Chromatiales bacterium]